MITPGWVDLIGAAGAQVLRVSGASSKVDNHPGHIALGAAGRLTRHGFQVQMVPAAMLPHLS